jgi:CheY-like chemotaxis protein/predicted regulator of Ras-like GTPase activity (Roadblock/LC7/MglB family)
MKNVLIVDDEKLFLLSLQEGFSAYAKDFNVIPAENGAKAIACLDSTQIDLVVTDLKMPVLDGFGLLAHMSRHYPQIPTIVMTAFGSTPEIENKLEHFGVSQYIEKPVDYRKMASMILGELKFGSTGHLQGITLPTFLQLIEMEKKTCTLTIKSGEEFGYWYFRKGDLLDAETGKLSGIEAAYLMLGWANTEIEISAQCKKRTKSIQASMNEMLMEGMRRLDEQERGRITVETAATPKDRIEYDLLSQDTSLKKEGIMALEKYLQGLKEVKGFKAAGIMNYTGEMLAVESEDANINLSLVGATFNDIFRSAHEASKKIGLDACKETVISTPKGIVVMRCSGVDSKSHFHIIGIMASDGNQALMKMQMDKMVPAVMDELA